MKLRGYLLIAAMLFSSFVFPHKAKADDPTYLGPIETESAADWGGQWVPYMDDTCGSNYVIDQYALSVDGAVEQNAYHWACSTDGTEGGAYASYILYTDSEWAYE